MKAIKGLHRDYAHEIVRLLGEENVVSRTLVTSARGYRKLSHHGISLDDTVSLASLGSG